MGTLLPPAVPEGRSGSALERSVTGPAAIGRLERNRSRVVRRKTRSMENLLPDLAKQDPADYGDNPILTQPPGWPVRTSFRPSRSVGFPGHGEAAGLPAARPVPLELSVHQLHLAGEKVFAVVDLEGEGLAVERGMDERPALLLILQGDDRHACQGPLVARQDEGDGA